MKKRKILLIVFIILSIGLLMVYSSSHIWAQYKENDSFYYFKRQAIFVIVGLLLLFFFSKIDYHLYQKHSLKIIILATILLVLVLIPGVGIVRGGSRSWFNLGLFALQPSEIYKIALIIYVSDYISHHYHQMKKLRYCLKPLIVINDYYYPFPVSIYYFFRIIWNFNDYFNDYFCSLSNEKNFCFFRSFSRSIRIRISNDSITLCYWSWRNFRKWF